MWHHVYLFEQGKMKWCNMLKKNVHWLKLTSTFLDSDSSPDAVANAGEIIVNVFGGVDNTLNILRFTSFVKSAATSKINLAHLPPPQRLQGTTRSGHITRSKSDKRRETPYWLGVNTAERAYERVHMTGCSCRKAELRCSTMCASCQGQNYYNTAPIVLDDEDDPVTYDDSSKLQPSVLPPPSETDYVRTGHLKRLKCWKITAICIGIQFLLFVIKFTCSL